MPKRCVQCRNPHFDGTCSCGQWGEAEERKAAEWHEKNNRNNELARIAKRAEAKAAEPDPELADVEDLEGLWDKKTFREKMDDPNPGHKAPKTLCGWCDTEMEQSSKILNGKNVMVCPNDCMHRWQRGDIEGPYKQPKENPK